jgi:hypothetical protein
MDSIVTSYDVLSSIITKQKVIEYYNFLGAMWTQGRNANNALRHATLFENWYQSQPSGWDQWLAKHC